MAGNLTHIIIVFNLWLKNGVTPNVLLETSEKNLIHEIARRN